MSDIKLNRITVVGLGYVGLTLALAFGRVVPSMGLEIMWKKLMPILKDLTR